MWADRGPLIVGAVDGHFSRNFYHCATRAEDLLGANKGIIVVHLWLSLFEGWAGGDGLTWILDGSLSFSIFHCTKLLYYKVLSCEWKTSASPSSTML